MICFQAEDGIRDIGVTGVQTCALPIWGTGPCSGRRARCTVGDDGLAGLGLVAAPARLGLLPPRGQCPRGVAVRFPPPGEDRSEERRVGKECRSRWPPYH